MRKAVKELDLDGILEVVSGDYEDEVLASVLKGHLALESLVVELIQQVRPGNFAWRLNFPKKTEYLVDEGVFDNELKNALDTVNDFRNDFAHIFGHSTNIPSILDLAKKLEAGGIVFTDDIAHLDDETATEWYGGELGLLAEIFKHLLIDIGYILMERGGRDIFSA